MLLPRIFWKGFDQLTVYRGINRYTRCTYKACTLSKPYLRTARYHNSSFLLNLSVIFVIKHGIKTNEMQCNFFLQKINKKCLYFRNQSLGLWTVLFIGKLYYIDGHCQILKWYIHTYLPHCFSIHLQSKKFIYIKY